MNVLRKLALTAAYITSFPGMPKAESEADLEGLAKYLPTIGTIIGGILFACAYGIDLLSHERILSSFLIVGIWLLITGAIHLDGLMDTADGLFSHRSRDQMLAIMKDSRVGNFGAISGVMLLLAKIIALYSLEPCGLKMAAVLFIPAWARWSEVFAIVCFPYAKPEGMGKVWHESSNFWDLAWAAIVPLILTIAIAASWQSAIPFIVMVATIGAGMLFALRVHYILYGHTGDTYGATVEFSEAAALIILALMQGLI